MPSANSGSGNEQREIIKIDKKANLLIINTQGRHGPFSSYLIFGKKELTIKRKRPNKI
jgi:hypothetical protein